MDRTNFVLPGILKTFLFLCLLACMTVAPGCDGCDGYQEEDDGFHVRPEEHFDAVLANVHDVSPSFYGLMVEQGQAWKYSLATLQKLHKDRPRWNVKLILSHISGSTDPILCETSFRGLKNRFAGPQEFRQFIDSKIDRFGGSRVHASIRKTLDHVLAIPGIKDRKIPSSLLVYSDMDDTEFYDQEAKQKLLQALKEYAKTRSSIALYFVNNELRETWQQHLRQAGFTDKRFLVHGTFQDPPPFPSLK